MARGSGGGGGVDCGVCSTVGGMKRRWDLKKRLMKCLRVSIIVFIVTPSVHCTKLDGALCPEDPVEVGNTMTITCSLDLDQSYFTVNAVVSVSFESTELSAELASCERTNGKDCQTLSGRYAFEVLEEERDAILTVSNVTASDAGTYVCHQLWSGKQDPAYSCIVTIKGADISSTANVTTGQGLDSGAVIGITIGVIAFVCIVVIVIVILLIRVYRKLRAASRSNSSTLHVPPGIPLDLAEQTPGAAEGTEEETTGLLQSASESENLPATTPDVCTDPIEDIAHRNSTSTEESCAPVPMAGENTASSVTAAPEVGPGPTEDVADRDSTSPEASCAPEPMPAENKESSATAAPEVGPGPTEDVADRDSTSPEASCAPEPMPAENKESGPQEMEKKEDDEGSKQEYTGMSSNK